ncbi:vWA domain-containing protein [Bdellovibrio sp. ArHS]|uniref:vWA domain-containing protein n=1 Tax=Bdellovibrio sp. ArHS TaxID=1569284 RepID=UPI0025C1C0D5|nr:vWA domain-containing protein [Bdellovibrio sp. ArHS]
MKRSTAILLALICIGAFQNCSRSVAFREEGAVSTNLATEVFTVNSSENSALDMIWVIDNSGSMADNAAQVRSNLSSFLEQLDDKADFRFLLLSGTGTHGATLPNDLPSSYYRQITTSVGSKNGPALLLSALSATELKEFFRVDSQKVIVFVTDDNSNLSANSFLSSLLSMTQWPTSQVMVSSFVGMGASVSPCQSATGSVYTSLASLTKGKAYNICNEDWSANFADLLDKSIAQIEHRFVLKAPGIAEVTSVTVDSQILAATDYSWEANVLIISNEVILSPGAMVEVSYSTAPE